MMHARTTRSASPWRLAWQRLQRNRAAMASLLFLLLLAALSLLAPLLTRYGYEQQNLELGAAAPDLTHWLGTDKLGRDLLTRLLYGGRISLAVGLCATAVSLLIGVSYGAIAGYAGGRLDRLMMRVVDVLYALPFTVFAILLMVMFEGGSILLLFAAIGAVEWLTMARIVRGQVMTVKDYISPSEQEPHVIHIVIGAPGLSAAPAIADYVIKLLDDAGFKAEEKKTTRLQHRRWPRFEIASVEQRQRMIAENPKHGHILCRCEQVTEAEIREAIGKGAGN